MITINTLGAPPPGLGGGAPGPQPLTQRVGLAVLVGHGEHAHHLVALLPQAAVDLLAEHALADDGQLQLVLVVMLPGRQDQDNMLMRWAGLRVCGRGFDDA